jgi:hypothetical protein
MLVSVQDFEGGAATTSTEISDDNSYDSDTVMDDGDRDYQRAPVPKLTEEQLMMCSTIVKGYALKDKKWGRLSLRKCGGDEF